MENDEPTALEMNEAVSNGWRQPEPRDGDAPARDEYRILKARLHSIIVTAKGRGTFDVR